MAHHLEPGVFLELLGLEAVHPTFESNGIDSETLADLSADDLGEMDVPEADQQRLLWGIQQVLPLHDLLAGMGLQEYLPNFVENEVGMDQVSSLTKDDLVEMGIKALGHRKKILAAGAAPAPAAPAEPAAAPEAITDPAELEKLIAQSEDLKETMRGFLRNPENGPAIDGLAAPPGPGSDFSPRLQDLLTREAACRDVREEYADLQARLDSAQKAFAGAGKGAPAQEEKGGGGPLGALGMGFGGLGDMAAGKPPDISKIASQMTSMTGQLIPGGGGVDTSGHPLGHHAEALGKGVVEGVNAGVIATTSSAIGEVQSAKAEVDRLNAEHAELDNATGFLAKTKAKAQQVMITGKLNMAEQKQAAAATALGLAVLQAGDEEAHRCPQTASVLDRIASERGALAEFQEQVDAARGAIEAKQPEWCERTGMAAITSVADVDVEAGRLDEEQIRLVTETLEELITGCRAGTLPDNFPLTERIEQMLSMEKQIKQSESLLQRLREEQQQQQQSSGGGGGPEPDNSTYKLTGADLEITSWAGQFMHMDPLTAIELKSGSPEDRIALAQKANIALIYSCAMNKVNSRLKAPGSARHKATEQMVLNKDIILYENGVIEVKGFVDAQNSFGAALRSTYRVWVYFTAVEGEGAEQTGSFGGKVVHMSK